MKKLEDLKNDILNNRFQQFYVFYGEDYGIRRHYIKKLGENFQKVSMVSSCQAITDKTVVKSLFSIKELCIIYNDLEFPRKDINYIKTFIERLGVYTIILVYEEPLESSTLWKHFSEYITYFPVVQDNVAVEFVEDEVKLLEADTRNLSHNCKNNYNNILLEADKIRSYADAKGMSEQNSYEVLTDKQQLLEELESYNPNLFTEDVLTGMHTNIAYWTYIIKQQDVDKFYYTLTSVFYDYLIAHLIKKYGKYDGSSRAYRYGLPWGRAKILRELNIIYDADYLLDTAYRIAEIDKNVKTGKLAREDLIDYFISVVI